MRQSNMPSSKFAVCYIYYSRVVYRPFSDIKSLQQWVRRNKNKYRGIVRFMDKQPFVIIGTQAVSRRSLELKVQELQKSISVLNELRNYGHQLEIK